MNTQNKEALIAEIERFKLFSLQRLKYGKSFVNDLDNSMMSKFVEAHRQINLAKVA